MNSIVLTHDSFINAVYDSMSIINNKRNSLNIILENVVASSELLASSEYQSYDEHYPNIDNWDTVY